MSGLVQILPDVGSLAHVVQTLQLAITPAFLLAAIASILNVLSSRLARVVDRARRITEIFEKGKAEGQTKLVHELRVLDRRIGLASTSIMLCVGSAIIVCSVVAILFIARLVGFPLGDMIAVMFIFAMALLIVGLILFMLEVRIATRALHIRADLLHLPKDNAA